MKSRSFLTSRGVSYTIREVEKREVGTKIQPAVPWMARDITRTFYSVSSFNFGRTLNYIP